MWTLGISTILYLFNIHGISWFTHNTVFLYALLYGCTTSQFCVLEHFLNLIPRCPYFFKYKIFLRSSGAKNLTFMTIFQWLYQEWSCVNFHDSWCKKRHCHVFYLMVTPTDSFVFYLFYFGEHKYTYICLQEHSSCTFFFLDISSGSYK